MMKRLLILVSTGNTSLNLRCLNNSGDVISNLFSLLILKAYIALFSLKARADNGEDVSAECEDLALRYKALAAYVNALITKEDTNDCLYIHAIIMKQERK